MKRTPPVPTDDVRPAYDFATMKGGVRGKYVRRIREGTNIVLIEPEVVRDSSKHDSAAAGKNS